MAQLREPEPGAAVSLVQEVSEEELRPPRRVLLGDQPWAKPEVLDQLFAAKALIGERVSARHFAVPADGQIVSYADLYLDGRDAQIEDVGTLPDHRGAGTRRPSWWRRPRPHGTPAPISSSSWPTRTIGPRSSTAASASTSSATTRSSSYRGVRDPGARRPRAREALRPHGRPRRGRPRGRRGRARRATRTERRRQVDARQDRLRACPAVARDGRDLWRSRRLARRAASARLPRRALPLSRLVLGRRGARAAPAALGLRGRRIGAARAARARRAERRPRPPRRADVEGHAAAPGDRAGAGRLAAAPAPGRADERARSGRQADGAAAAGGAAAARDVGAAELAPAERSRARLRPGGDPAGRLGRRGRLAGGARPGPRRGG